MSELKIPNGDIDDWLSELKLYQKNTVLKILTSCSPEEAAEIWITATGHENTIPFGGSRDTKPFWDKFKAEFKKFICDDNSYAEEKKALMAESSVTKSILIGVISAAIGAAIGYTATLLAPAVAILLCTVGKIGKNAYCKDG